MTAMFLTDRTRRIIIGRCIQKSQGWKFQPHTDVHSPSRKHWPSANDCIPRWAHKVGGDHAELLTLEEVKAAGLWK